MSEVPFSKAYLNGCEDDIWYGHLVHPGCLPQYGLGLLHPPLGQEPAGRLGDQPGVGGGGQTTSAGHMGVGE